MRDPRFALWSGILMVGKTSVAEDLPTAATNGRDEFYGREFVKSLKYNELNFVVLHEAGHKMYRHLTTWRRLYEEDAKLANAACDYVLNIMLKDLDPSERTICMPRYPKGHKKAGEIMGLIDERFRGMSAKQVYDILKQEQEGDGGQGGGDGDGGGDGFDEHQWGSAKDMTEQEKKELARDIDQAVRQGVMAQNKIAGKSAGGMDRSLQDLLEPKVDWREVLREFVKATSRAKDASSWRRVNRRFRSTGSYMPSLIGEKVGPLGVGVDTTGSVGQEELSDFLSEVKGIAEEVNPEKVDLIYWDHSVAAHEEYDEGSVANIVSSTKPRGGGGTSPSCVSEYLDKQKIEPECTIILTDGYVGNDWGEGWTSPVLWVIVGGNDVVAPNGKTIHIKD
jgi:predicted metal-dependent peptidase